jgi:DNA uptake protein ComE-like DNA-binding protein
MKRVLSGRRNPASPVRRTEWRNSRRGSVLFAVFVMIVLAALIGTTLLYRGDGYAAGVDAQRLERRLRAAAWSGVCLAAERLGSQRDELLAGATPRLGSELVIESEGEPRFVVRFEELTDAGAQSIAEGARLNLNTATESMLASAPGFDGVIAARLVASRGTGFDSVETALGAIMPGGDEEENDAAPPGASDFTVFSFDPAVTGSGGGSEGSDGGGAGRRRIVLAGAWDDAKAAALKERLPSEAAQAIDEAMKGQQPPRRPAGLVRVLARLGVPTAQWATVLDEVAFVRDDYIAGLVDINSASEAVLACVPGIDASAAARLIVTRETLAAAQRARVTWPLTEGVLPLANFEEAVNFITTRSLQWRIRVEAVREDDDPTGERARLPGRHVVLEAVIDVASTRPRIAYLRDATYDDLAAAMREMTRMEQRGAWPVPGPEPAAIEAPAPEAAPEQSPPVRPAVARRAARAERAAQPSAPEPEPAARDPRVGRWRPTNRP